FGGVYRMVGTVNQCSLQTNNRITCQNTVFYAVLQAFFNGWEEGLRNSTAEDLFFKYQAITNGWLKFDPNVTELTVTTGLFLMFTLNFDLLAEGLAVSVTRIFQRNGNAEFILEFGNQYIQMLFA